MTWTEEQVAILVDTHFHDRVLRCPDDGARVVVEEFSGLGSGGKVDLYFRCSRCNTVANWSDAAASTAPNWTKKQRRAIVEDYWKNRNARCPADQTRLSVHESQTLGGGARETQILVHCRRCGRHFDSERTYLLGPGEEVESSRFEERYVVLKEIGRGGMGVVQLVQGPDGRQYAAKRLQEKSNLDAEDVQRFQRELTILRSLPPHPNVVAVVEDFFATGQMIFVMELMTGGDLRAVIQDGSRGPLERARLFREAATGVAHLHEHEVIHRDLKPANILIDAERHARIGDFGLARSEVQSSTTPLTRSGEGFGTDLYMAPEQRHGARHAGRPADVYSLGVIAAELVTRRRPTPEVTLELREGTDLFAATLTTALLEDPKKRTTSPLELAEAVRQRLELEAEPTAPVT